MAVKKLANGDGTKEYAIRLTNELRGVAGELGHRYSFDKCVKKHGREKVALCVAATMVARPTEFELHQKTWAKDVLATWENRLPRSLLAAATDLHSAILADVSGSLRRFTVREG